MEPIIIDTHAHLVHNYDPAHLDQVVESGLVKQVWLLPLNLYTPEFEFARDDEVLEVGKRYPGVFLPFGFIDYFKGPEQVDQMKEQGFVALKAIRPPKPYDDESYFPIYERAEALGMPILFHVGIISKGFWHNEGVEGFPGPRCMKPSMLDTIADLFPDLTLIQGHQGVPWVNELWESLYYYPNISCSVCGLIDYEWLIRHLDDIDSQKLPFFRRLMFAVDGLYGSREHWNNMVESAVFTEEFFSRVGRTHAWSKGVEDFMSGNAERLSLKFKK